GEGDATEHGAVEHVHGATGARVGGADEHVRAPVAVEIGHREPLPEAVAVADEHAVGVGRRTVHPRDVAGPRPETGGNAVAAGRDLVVVVVAVAGGGHEPDGAGAGEHAGRAAEAVAVAVFVEGLQVGGVVVHGVVAVIVRAVAALAGAREHVGAGVVAIA